MTGLIMAAQLILGLSLLVFIHELGHYLAARAFGIRVEKFYMFFDAWNFRLFRFKWGETEYGIGWLPLGGYCKIAGMIDESMDKEAMKQPPKPWEFRTKPAWQRLIVMLAGVIMNVILGMFLFAFVTFHYEKEYLPTDQLDNGIYAYSSGRDIGFQTGDKIIAINGKHVERFKDVRNTNILLGGTVTITRDGQQKDIVIPNDFFLTFTKTNARDFFIDAHNFPCTIDSVLEGKPAALGGVQQGDQILRVDSLTISSYGLFRESIWDRKGQNTRLTVKRGADTLALDVAVDTTGVIGILSNVPYKNKEYSVGAAINYGISDAMGNVWANARGLGRIFTGEVKATDSLQGPIGIAKIYGGVWSWYRFWLITGLLSMILAFMNILPIPALDGGHVIFTTIELITGKKFSDKFMEKAQMVGMVILLALMVFAIGNDLWKSFF